MTIRLETKDQEDVSRLLDAVIEVRFSVVKLCVGGEGAGRGGEGRGGAGQGGAGRGGKGREGEGRGGKGRML